MHEKIGSVHVTFDQGFVLLSISATNDEIVLTSDEPDELFEPENLALYTANLSLLQLLVVASGSFLSLCDSDFGSILCLDLFSVGFFADLKVLLDIELGRDAQVDVNAHHLVKVTHKLVVDLKAIFISLIDGIKYQ